MLWLLLLVIGIVLLLSGVFNGLDGQFNTDKHHWIC